MVEVVTSFFNPRSLPWPITCRPYVFSFVPSPVVRCCAQSLALSRTATCDSRYRAMPSCSLPSDCVLYRVAAAILLASVRQHSGLCDDVKVDSKIDVVKSLDNLLLLRRGYLHITGKYVKHHLVMFGPEIDVVVAILSETEELYLSKAGNSRLRRGL
ncbi:hypothetical protein ACFE04_019874 [Oxalis oulophora]